MPRSYKANPNRKRYKKYDGNTMQKALHEYKTQKISLQAVAEKYKISKSVLYRHSTRKMKKQGGQTVLAEDTEEVIVQYIIVCAGSGYPLDPLSLRFLIKCCLDKLEITVPRFRNNLPGSDFLQNFLYRHRDQMCSSLNTQNVKIYCIK